MIKKKRNPADDTGRNRRATRRKVTKVELEIRELKGQIAAIWKVIRKKWLLPALVGLWLNPGSIQAQRLNIVQVGGYLAVSQEAAKEIYRRSAWYFSELGLVLRVRFGSIGSNPCANLHSIFTPSSELHCFDKLGIDRPRTITFFMTPPYVTVEEAYGPQTAWIAGLAFLCGNVAMGNAVEYRLRNGITGPSLLNHDATILAHETSHTLCAKHIDKAENLMHPAANEFTDKYLGRIPVLPETKLQVKRTKIRARKVAYAELRNL